MKNNYKSLSRVYDRFTRNVDYRLYSWLIHRELKQNNIKGIVLDAGCGTGTLTLLLDKLGYDMIGADISEDMLAVANDKSVKSKKPITFLCQDLTKLDLYGTVNAIICSLDTINHIESEKDLKKVFSRFSLFTEPNGLLIFDINTSYKHSKVLADNTFVFDDGDNVLVWQNEYDSKKKRVLISTDLFSSDGQGLYERSSDAFYEYDYTVKVIERLLSKTGYSLLKHFDFENERDICEATERIVFVAKKVEGIEK